MTEQTVHLAGFTCLRCGEGLYANYAWDEEKQAWGTWTTPCEVCGHKMPGELPVEEFRTIVRIRDTYLGGSLLVQRLRAERNRT